MCLYKEDIDTDLPSRKVHRSRGASAASVGGNILGICLEVKQKFTLRRHDHIMYMHGSTAYIHTMQVSEILPCNRICLLASISEFSVGLRYRRRSWRYVATRRHLFPNGLHLFILVPCHVAHMSPTLLPQHRHGCTHTMATLASHVVNSIASTPPWLSSYYGDACLNYVQEFNSSR